MNTPPKYLSTPHWPWSLSVHRDDSYHKNPEFFLNKEVVITEKLDGGNTCLFNGKVFARSTGQEATQGWFAMVKKHHAWKTLGEVETSFYGEDIYGIHSIEYDPVYEHETFYLFCVRFTPEIPSGLPGMDIIWDWDTIEKIAIQMSFKTVPVVFRGTFKTVKEITNFFNSEIVKPSALGPVKEGFVMRVTNQFDVENFSENMCKFVRKNHVQTDEHWTKNWKPCRLKK